MNIYELKPGRELDMLIAPLVGWRVDDLTAYSPNGSAHSRTAHGDDDWLPHYSTDISAAWEVVEKLDMTFHLTKEYCGYFVIFNASTRDFVIEKTAPHAICLAALKVTK